MTHTYEQINPTHITIGDNVRLDPRLDTDFIASIRERGVLEPVLLYRDGDGTLTVLAGQRRTLAARAAGRTTIPALVSDTPPDQADRLVDQYVENEHRAPLTNSERITAIEQMALAGLSDHQIAKRTATPKATVQAAKAAAQAPALREYADQLTLDQAAALTEFDDDPDAVEALLAAATTGRFDHVAQRLRDDRAEAAHRAEFAATLTDQGLTVIDDPGYGDTTPIRRLTRLTDDDGTDLTPDTHAQCPGHAAYITTAWRTPTTDDQEPAGDVDDQDDDQNGDEDEPWVPQVQVLVAGYVCTDFAAHGHHDRYASTNASPSGTKRVADMTDTEREAATAARRNVIESNKAWKAATQVRRTWITTFAQRKTAPTGAEAYLARVLIGGHGHETASHEALTLAGFPGRDGTTSWTAASEQRAADATGTASPKRALQIGLAVAVAMWEERTHPNTWRNPSSHDLDTLARLKDWGYPTSDLEDRMLTSPDEDPTD